MRTADATLGVHYEEQEAAENGVGEIAAFMRQPDAEAYAEANDGVVRSLAGLTD
ncbi:hypothetical protein HC341_18385 [Aquisalimonas sp. 2447]|uniref:hypothetical protein n=1 Tax=Aquisalimonas sp. 2447 TaxID=2740807 RepID=UPI00143251B4|nr:hypothetical protein [Aquisalimonas sp. 2447]QIT56991.1 hypothetical protein HC341_18385 [Aquisalimonas sp. 2447]